MYQLLTGIAVFIPAFFYPQLFLVFFTGIVSMLSVSITYGIHLKLKKSFWVNLLFLICIAQFLFPVVTLMATFKPSIYWKGDKLDEKG